MGIDYGFINHTKKQFLATDRRFHDFDRAAGEWICAHWLGDHLEVASDTGGRLSAAREDWGYQRVNILDVEEWFDEHF